MKRTQVCLLVKASSTDEETVNIIKTDLGFDGTIPVIVMGSDKTNPHLVPTDADVGGIIIAGLPHLAAGFRELFPKTMIVVLSDAVPSPTISDVGYTSCPHEAALAIEESIRVATLHNTDILVVEGLATANEIEKIVAAS